MTKPTVKGGLAPANAVDVKGRGSADYNAARYRMGDYAALRVRSPNTS